MGNVKNEVASADMLVFLANVLESVVMACAKRLNWELNEFLDGDAAYVHSSKSTT